VVLLGHVLTLRGRRALAAENHGLADLFISLCRAKDPDDTVGTALALMPARLARTLAGPTGGRSSGGFSQRTRNRRIGKKFAHRIPSSPCYSNYTLNEFVFQGTFNNLSSLLRTPR
jgi:hypothetical protein